ncbi:MAG: DUF4058 family protein [Alkalinema sp. FL-bin-369]|nr:DUF4058 family protein [Leptolyngbyaceae cyanobacterium LF-bin-369]
MLNPFLGMNPYLEHPELWHQVHNHLITGIAFAIADQIAPQYRVSIEQRMYQSLDDPRSIVGIADVSVNPDVSVKLDVLQNDYSRDHGRAVSTLIRPQRVQLPIPWDVKEQYLEVREVATKELITVIEVLSPANKRSGKGRSIYEAKRTKILTSMTNLIEIDVLRLGQPMAMMGATESQYRILVSRPFDRPEADLFRFNLQDSIPNFPVPLRPESPDAIVDLQAILNETYQRGRLDLSIDYSQERLNDRLPGLSESDRGWVLSTIDESKNRVL